jgi:tetratricopeptide (TPR) repeat protein
VRPRLLRTDIAVKHLLQHLHDASELRLNPLAEPYFSRDRSDDAGALLRIKDAVTAAIARCFDDASVGRARVHLQRQREIVLRCDIAGEADKAVLGDIGLERRQFYREKRLARIRLGEALQHSVPSRSIGDAEVIDPCRIAMAHFRVLRDSGDSASAVALLQSLRANVTDPKRKMEIACLLVESFAENAWWTQALDMLRTASEIDATDDASRAWLAWAKGQIAWYHGTYSTAESLGREAVDYMLAANGDRTPEDDELLAMTYMQLAHSRHGLGAYDASFDALRAAREVVERQKEMPARVRVNLLFHLGGVLATRPGHARTAARYLREACLLSTRHGLARDAAGSALNLARAYLILGEVDRALEIGRQGLATSRRVHGVAAHGWHCLSFAIIELAAGNADAALELARFGGSTEAHDMPRAGYARTVEASALLQLGEPQRARVLAEAGSTVLRAHAQQPLLGFALRVLAESAYQCGDGVAARNASDESVQLLQRFGHPYSLATALRSRAAITGKTSYEHDARDLIASLRTAQP